MTRERIPVHSHLGTSDSPHRSAVCGSTSCRVYAPKNARLYALAPRASSPRCEVTCPRCVKRGINARARGEAWALVIEIEPPPSGEPS